MQLAIISSKTKLSGKLTKFWTGSYAYHCGFVDIASDTFYDMHLNPRCTTWTEHGYKDVQLFDVNITREECQRYRIQDRKEIYGFVDYTLFALRKIYHLLGYSTRNGGGIICSEMLNNWLWRKDTGATPFNPMDAPPSPADLERFFKLMDRL
jgi:hypothetical protein